jgi:hypothetical protein
MASSKNKKTDVLFWKETNILLSALYFIDRSEDVVR